MLLLKDGDKNAFNEIYERHWQRMAEYVLRVIKSQDEAQDIVQEIFVSIWRRRETIEIKGSLVAYLLKSARNLSLKYIEKNLHKENFYHSLSTHLADVQLLKLTPIEVKEMEEQLERAIDALPSKMREVFRLSRFENKSYKEIAAELGIAETTVKKQINNALKIIRSQFGGQNVNKMLLYMLLFFSR